MNRYAIVDGAGNVVNIVQWDGVAEWSPPDGTIAVLDTAVIVDGSYVGGAVIGGSYSAGRFLPPT